MCYLRHRHPWIREEGIYLVCVVGLLIVHLAQELAQYLGPALNVTEMHERVGDFLAGVAVRDEVGRVLPLHLGGFGDRAELFVRKELVHCLHQCLALR